MNNELSASAQKVQDALRALGLQFQVVELPTSTRTAQEAAQSIGCTVAQIVKSLVFRVPQTDQPILVLASGPNRVNEARISKQVVHQLRKQMRTLCAKEPDLRSAVCRLSGI